MTSLDVRIANVSCIIVRLANPVVPVAEVDSQNAGRKGRGHRAGQR